MSVIIITQNNSGERIDRFLTRESFSYTRADIIRSIKVGQVLVNKKTIKPSYKLKEADELTINLKKEGPALTANKKIKLEVIYQNEDIVIINKLVGLQIHPAYSLQSNKKRTEKTLVNGLLALYPEIKTVGDDPANRPGIVHRLDRDTSGVMVIAKNQKTFLQLKNLFKTHQVKKTYWALVIGNLGKEGDRGIINKPLARSSNYKKQVIAGKKTKTKIRSASTEYKILKTWNGFSLLEINLKTGRMHQIRVHLTSLGCPLVGDQKYQLKNVTGPKNITHQLLHAKRIAFTLNEHQYEFEAKLPTVFQKFLTFLDENKVKGYDEKAKKQN